MGSRTNWLPLLTALVAVALIAGISANSPAGETKQGVQWRDRTPAFFTTDEAVKVGVTLVNIGTKEQAGKLTYKLVDYYGDVALKGEFEGLGLCRGRGRHTDRKRKRTSHFHIFVHRFGLP